MTAVVARIAIRYLAGILLAKGIIDASLSAQITADPDVLAIAQSAAGVVLGAATEGWYWLAKKFGWRT